MPGLDGRAKACQVADGLFVFICAVSTMSVRRENRMYPTKVAPGKGL